MTLHELLDESGWEEAIIKPCISGAARHTYRVNRVSAAALEPVVRQLLSDESLILQPFQQSAMDHGEDTLMLFNGRFTHAVKKVPKPGDFRVQDDHGGKQGNLAVMELELELELELIEPELWLRNYPLAATAFADAIAKIVLA